MRTRWCGCRGPARPPSTAATCQSRPAAQGGAAHEAARSCGNRTHWETRLTACCDLACSACSLLGPATKLLAINAGRGSRAAGQSTLGRAADRGGDTFVLVMEKVCGLNQKGANSRHTATCRHCPRYLCQNFAEEGSQAPSMHGVHFRLEASPETTQRMIPAVER